MAAVNGRGWWGKRCGDVNFAFVELAGAGVRALMTFKEKGYYRSL